MRPLSLFVHSTGTGAPLWAHVPEDLTEGTDRLHASNLGYAPFPPVPRGQVVLLEDDLEHLIAQVGPVDRPIDVYAHSYGATLALGLVGRLPVRSLFLIEPVLFRALAARPNLPADVEAELRFFSEHPWFLEDAARGGTVEWLTLFVDYWNRPGAFAKMPPALQTGQLALGWKMFQEVRACFYATEAFPEVGVPLTLAVGERTTACARAMTAAMAEHNPHARVIVMPGTGHMAPLTHPGRVHAAIQLLLTLRAR